MGQKIDQLLEQINSLKENKARLSQEIEDQAHKFKKISRVNQVLQVISNVNQFIARTSNRDNFLENICEIFVDAKIYYSACIAHFDDNGNLDLFANAGYPPNHLEKLKSRLKAKKSIPCFNKARNNKNIITFKEGKEACKNCPLQEIYKQKSSLLMKLEYKEAIYGILKLDLHEDYEIDDFERSLFKEVASNLALALYNLRLEMDQNRLKKGNRIKANLLDGAIDSILLHDTEGNILYANKTACQKLQYSKKEMLSKSLFDLELEEKKVTVKRRLKRLKTEGDIKFESTIKNKSGHKIPIKVHSRYMQIDKERYVMGIFRDITSQKASEKKIKTSMRRYRMIFNNSPDPLAELDLSEIKKDLDASPLPSHQHIDKLASEESLAKWINKIKVDELNTDFIKLFGGKSKSHLRSNRLKIFTPPAIQKLSEIIQHFINNKSRYAGEIRMQTLQGKKLILAIHAQLVPEKKDDWSEVILALQDITSEKEFENVRNHLIEELYKNLEFKSRFLASTSHELRTPINSILGFTDLLLEEVYGHVNSDQKGFLGDIKTSAKHLLSLINQVLEHSKSQSGKISLVKEKVDLWDILSEIQSIIRPLHEQKDLKTSISIPKNGKLIADPIRLKQILYNLLSNAIKFTPEGKIVMRGIERSDHWEFQVEDTGMGIAPEDYDAVFREFGRSHNYKTQKIQGTGLGLSLTKRLVELHGGDIWFESEVDKGSTFYFTLPKA
ncbi:MAG: ATP-binding protein [Promethearchaeia archaeon]